MPPCDVDVPAAAAFHRSEGLTRAMTTYTSESAAHEAEERRRVAELQALVNLHAIDAASGRCGHCGVPGPCLPRKDALYILNVLRELPRRAVGATNPEHIGARRVHID